MKITVSIKSNYGNEMIYPVCEQAKLFALLSGHKTLTGQTIALIKKLGYEIEVEQPIRSL